MAGEIGEIDLRRRRLLSALALSPWLAGFPALAALPQPRIIALEWLPLEMLLALGVTPLAAADTRDYGLWVKEPALPAGLIDVGQRSEPNLEYIAELKPDLIVYSQGYGPHAAQLQNIAPTMEFAFTDEQGKPLAKVRSGLLSLAGRLGKTEEARLHLAWFDRQLVAAREQLIAWRRQPLLVFSLIDQRHAVILGNRSLFGNVMQQLGIENAWQGEDGFWGTATVGIEHLAMLPTLRAICLDHGDAAIRNRISTTPLWQALPFVRQNALRIVPAIWIFGATLAAQRFCHMLQELDKKW
ncbi:iron-hydroxamate transporter substrate-binding subunit [Erwinia typographi]|uniref:Iron-hydroxamate transporter substrate-binding subunit n=1 Tax=Erwinia typographi TaxID=371042 RepID=A0A0A3ZB06_9GAMM|nr:Fe(3+)-hydroxamate ABC transporter substrate-binding protein FhuD [Erwinia typographi]KGT96065.1 iron-hydroxamate transporter substrate-binding subunit [Erwinia typographi]